MEAKREITTTNKDELISFSGSFSDYFVSIVDIVESTKVTALLPAKQACKYYAIFLNAMAEIVEDFGGKVIKNVGDSLLYYFPKKIGLSEKILCKYSLECGIAMLGTEKRLNELMRKEKLPPVKYRISADYGTVIIARDNHSSLDDIFGPPVNICAKINRYACPNTIVIGGDMYQIARSFPEYSFKPCSEYSNGLKFSYPIYSIARNSPS
jgi:class 3 adenylate cyclase